MDDADDSCTPPEVREIAEHASSDLLPVRTRQKYEQTYETFKNWCIAKNVQPSRITENIVLAYLSELSNRYAASTLWTIYSMLRQTISLNLGVDIKAFAKVQALLKRGSTNHVAKKSAAFSRTNIEKFLCEADDQQFLHVKVVALFSLFGACRKSEILALTIDDVSDAGAHVLVTIRESKTGPCSFVIVGAGDSKMNALLYFRQYINLRPKNAPNRLFLGMRDSKCTRQPIGRNTIAGYPKKMLNYCGCQMQKNTLATLLGALLLRGWQTQVST
jgi:site-specific recombinase XerD